MNELVTLGSVAVDDSDGEVFTVTRRYGYEKYPAWAEEELNENEVRVLTKKIARHFKLGYYNISFFGNRGAVIYRFGKRIRFPHRTTISLICHELCHAICWKKYKTKIRHNTKKWMIQLNRLIRYCESKNGWKELIEKMRQPKPIKPEPTKEELRLKKIMHKKEMAKKYESKIKMYQTKLSKAKRSIKMLERNL